MKEDGYDVVLWYPHALSNIDRAFSFLQTAESEDKMSQKTMARKNVNLRKLTGIAMLSAVSTVLMFLNFSVPFMPGFIKLDISELPALLASFAYGPSAGVVVCLIKNLVNLFQTQTAGVGELSNFILGMCFTLPAGIIYKYHKNRRGAIVGALIGAVLMSVISLPSNYFITYPMYIEMYAKFGGWDAILDMYQAIYPGVDNLTECLIIFNMPFTFLKGIINSLACFLIYKPLSPVLHGHK